MLEFSERAVEVLRRASEAARRLNPEARVRLTVGVQGLEPVLADSPEPGDGETQAGDVPLFVQSGVHGLVDVQDPHDRLILRPPGASAGSSA